MIDEPPPADAATILIVDDLAANRETLFELLAPQGYAVLEAADGEEALRLAAERRPDLVLLDVMMPGMDGFEVCRRLRADPATAEMPIVIVTALEDHASRLAGLEAGADDVITKPFNRAELRSRVRTITRLNRFARLHHERAKVEAADRRIRRQAALIDLAPDAILVVGADDRVELWNAGAEQVYGWPAGEATGRHGGDVLRTADGDHFAAAARAVREAGEWRGEVSHLDREGNAVTVESRWTLMVGDDPRILIVNRDITEKKHSEERLLRAQRLENLGALAGGIVHDLNNVLSPILMATELLRTEAEAERFPRWIEMIDTSARRGAAMVKQVLSFARGSGTGTAPVQLRPLVRDLQRIVKDTFPSNITCDVHVDPHARPAMADATQVYQVLLNLAINARDAMPDGGRLAIDVRNATVDAAAPVPGLAPGDYVVIAVADNGDGIPAEILGRIFDPFFTTKPPGRGTGLGLATVREVIAAHGGSIAVASTVGDGARFTVYLPAASGPDESVAAGPAAVLPHGRNELVLFADDEAAVREITKATLENFNYRVALAGDGTEAVARFASHSHDISLLLTDLHMPFMDGLSAIRAIRRLAPDLPAIALSGSPDEGPMVARSGLTVQAVLTKPVSAATLVTEIDRVLRG